MKIKASVGRAPKTACLYEGVYSMTLTAQTLGERQWLAGLFLAVRDVSEEDTTLRTRVPDVRIVTKSMKPAGGGDDEGR